MIKPRSPGVAPFKDRKKFMLSFPFKQNTDVTNRWELAQYITSNAHAPEQALRSVFMDTIRKLEKTAAVTLPPSTQEKVWTAVSPERLKILKDTFVVELYNKILSIFKDSEINEMLESHKQTGIIRYEIYSAHLPTAYTIYREDIVKTIVKKAESMPKEWIPEIIAVVKKEGFQLPE